MQVLPGPKLVPTSQAAGGMVHSAALAQTAPGTPPGYDGGSETFNDNVDGPPHDMFGGAQTPVSTQPGKHGGVGLPPSVPSASPLPRVPAGSKEGGQWTQNSQGPGPEAGGQPAWVKTPAANGD
jgi:hypothetical protein